MSTRKFELVGVFDDCVNRLQRGQSVSECLSAYPRESVLLRPLLMTTTLAQKASYPSSEVTQAQNRVRVRVLQIAQQYHRPHRQYPFRQLALVAACFGLIFFLVLGTGVAMAQDALPGDTLYGVKRLSETVQLVLSGNSSELHQEFAQKRVAEVQDVLKLGREIHVSLDGTLRQSSPAHWQVAGIDVQIPDKLLIDLQKVQPGTPVEVQGKTTSQGQFIVTMILSVPPVQPIAQPELTIMPLPTSTPNFTEVPSALPDEANPPTNTIPMLIPTLSPAASDTPELEATSVPNDRPTPTEQESPSPGLEASSAPLENIQPTRQEMSPTLLPANDASGDMPTPTEVTDPSGQ